MAEKALSNFTAIDVTISSSIDFGARCISSERCFGENALIVVAITPVEDIGSNQDADQHCTSWWFTLLV